MQSSPIQIITNEVSKNLKLGPGTIKITPFLDVESRHSSCKGCPLLPSINIYNEQKEKVRLEGHYKTKKELGIASRLWLKDPKNLENKQLKTLIAIAAKELLKKGVMPTPKRIIDHLVETGKIPAMGCYAWNGKDRQATSSLEKASKKSPEKYVGLQGLKYRINNRRWSAKIVRIGSIGEFARLPKEDALKVVETIRESGLTVIAYTHQWFKNPHLKDSFRASCDNKVALKKALDNGWKAQIAIPQEQITSREMEILPGVDARVCDFYSDEWIADPDKKKTQGATDCNTCQKCKISKDDAAVIVMPFHR